MIATMASSRQLGQRVQMFICLAQATRLESSFDVFISSPSIVGGQLESPLYRFQPYNAREPGRS